MALSGLRLKVYVLCFSFVLILRQKRKRHVVLRFLTQLQVITAICKAFKQKEFLITSKF